MLTCKQIIDLKIFEIYDKDNCNILVWINVDCIDFGMRLQFQADIIPAFCQEQRLMVI